QFASFGTPSSIRKPIKLKVFSGLSCSSNIDSFITIYAQPKVAFSLPQDSLCGNDFPISLNQGVELNGALGAFSYTGNGVINLGANQFQFNPRLVAPNTIAAIQYKYTTSSNCYDTATQQITILPYPTVNAGLDRIVVQGEQTSLLATANGNNLQFSWTPSIYLNNPTDLQPIVNAQKTTYYLLKATTKEGCTDTSGVNVIVLPPINPPNSFSPNSDAINDTWIIPNINLYNNCEVSIFNRQGQLLFRSVGYNTPWNGTYKQQPLPVATYYYIINLRNGKAPLTGWLQLLR
ncbi:MAG: gliding motility-associated C-terminal domain-containing protein, partial [Dolichospermum sp.]